MVKFSHFADCHLGSWRQDELRELNFKSFQMAIDISIQEKVEFILISGDLFDSAYPPIEILKETFAEFKRIRDAGIKVYLIAGSHDFSASGKTFLDVLEKAGFCVNVEKSEVCEDGRIKLFPTFHKEIAIFGYPGKKSGMELEDLKKVYFDSVNLSTIFMVHTTISDVVGTLPIESIDKLKLPLANYYAFGHIHKVFEKQEACSTFVYPGPIFPNNFQELVDLKYGSFQIVEMNGPQIKSKNVKIPLKEVVYLEMEISDAFTATQEIISKIDKLNLQDKIFLLKLRGVLHKGKSGDIRFQEIEDFVQKKGIKIFLRNISSLRLEESEFEFAYWEQDSAEDVEKTIIEEYSYENPADFNKFLPQLMNVSGIEKNEDEKSTVFEERVVNELKKIFELEEVIR